MSRPETTQVEATRGLPWLGWLTMLLTAGMAALWSAHKLLEQDEIFSLQTDRVGSLAEVLRIQRYTPISLEPPPYHVLAHAAMSLFGPTAFALRLPAFVGFLVMQTCLYFFVRNLVRGTEPVLGGALPLDAGIVAERAGLVAMAIPALTWTLFYAAEGRPYGLLLGSYALAVLCWQVAARSQGKRSLPLAGLVLALALTLNVHFYGVLLLIPLWGAEALRTWQRKQLDRGMVGALLVGTATVLCTLPYVKSSGEFKKHYYAGPVSAHMLTQPYRQMLLNYTTYPHAVQTVLVLVLLVAAVAVVWSCTRVVRGGALAASGPEMLIVLLLVLMPAFAFVLGRLVTHALEARHSIGAIIGLVTLIAVALLPMLRSGRNFVVLMVVLLVGIVLVNAGRVRTSEAESAEVMRGLTLSPALLAQVNASADPHIYFQDLGEWETASLYEPDAAFRSRLVLVYSRDEEMQHEQHDTMYLTATHTQRFSSQPIMSYEAVRSAPGEHIFTTYRSGWNWTDAAFAAEAISVQPMGSAFGGDMVKVRFR